MRAKALIFYKNANTSRTRPHIFYRITHNIIDNTFKLFRICNDNRIFRHIIPILKRNASGFQIQRNFIHTILKVIF